ncbi:MAG: hypothetical protein QM692_16665 [Thermomicrobiales bacterium]
MGTPPHLQISDFGLSLEVGPAGTPQPVVQTLQARLSPAGLHFLAEGGIAEAGRRAPVGMQLQSIAVNDAGIDVKVRISKSIIKGELGTRLALSAPGGQLLRVELTNVEMPAWVPLDLVLEAAVKRSNGLVQRDPANSRALLLNPATLLSSFGVPARFAPGKWAVATSTDGIDLGFQEA